MLVTTELRGSVGRILRSDAPTGPLHALGYQLRLEFAPLIFVHAVDRWRSLMHAHYFTGIGLVGAQRRLFWSAGMGVAFNPFGVGPEVEGRVGYAIGRRSRLRWVFGLYARSGFTIAYHQIPTMAAGAFVGLFRF